MSRCRTSGWMHLVLICRYVNVRHWCPSCWQQPPFALPACECREHACKAHSGPEPSYGPARKEFSPSSRQQPWLFRVCRFVVLGVPLGFPFNQAQKVKKSTNFKNQTPAQGFIHTWWSSSGKSATLKAESSFGVQTPNRTKGPVAISSLLFRR